MMSCRLTQNPDYLRYAVRYPLYFDFLHSAALLAPRFWGRRVAFLAFLALGCGHSSLAEALRPSKMTCSGVLMAAKGPGASSTERGLLPRRCWWAADRPRSLPVRPAMDCCSGVGFARYFVLLEGAAAADLARERSAARVVLRGSLARVTRSLRGRRGGNFFSLRRRAASTSMPSWRRDY